MTKNQSKAHWWIVENHPGFEVNPPNKYIEICDIVFDALHQGQSLPIDSVISIYVCGYCGRLLDDNNYPLKIQKEVPTDAIKVEGGCCIMKERLYSSV